MMRGVSLVILDGVLPASGSLIGISFLIYSFIENISCPFDLGFFFFTYDSCLLFLKHLNIPECSIHWILNIQCFPWLNDSVALPSLQDLILALHLTHLSVSLSSELLIWLSECFILHFISFWLIFNDSISLLNFILISWIIFITILYNITYSTLCFCGSYSDIHTLVEFLECIYYCYFEIIVLSVIYVAFLRDHFYGGFWRKFLILGETYCLHYTYVVCAFVTGHKHLN